MIISVEDLINTSDMKMTDEEIYQGLVKLGYIEDGDWIVKDNKGNMYAMQQHELDPY